MRFGEDFLMNQSSKVKASHRSNVEKLRTNKTALVVTISHQKQVTMSSAMEQKYPDVQFISDA